MSALNSGDAEWLRAAVHRQLEALLVQSGSLRLADLAQDVGRERRAVGARDVREVLVDEHAADHRRAARGVQKNCERSIALMRLECIARTASSAGSGLSDVERLRAQAAPAS